MAAGDEDVRTLLDEVAQQAGGLRVTRAGVERAVRRRRMNRAVAAAAVAVAVVAVAVPLSRADRPGGTGSAADQAGGLACGAAIPQPTVGTADPGLRLTVTNVVRDAAGRPNAATVTLTSTAEARLAVLGRTPLQLLLLRDGVVVDRLATYSPTSDGLASDWIATGPNGTSGRGAIGISRLVSPTSPWVVRVAGPGHCRPAPAGAGGYTVTAVMSVPRSEEFPGSEDPRDPLLVSDPVR